MAQLSVMGNEDKSAMEKRKAERERTLGILQLNPMPYQFLLSSLYLSHSFLSSSLLTSRNLHPSMTVILDSTVSSFSPFSFVSFVIQYTAAYDRNLNPPPDSTDTPGSNSGFVNRFTWKHFLLAAE